MKECIFLTKIFCKGSLRLTVTNVQGGLSHTTGTPCKGFLRRRHTDAVFVTKLDRLPACCVFPTLATVFVVRQKTIVKRGKNQLYLIEPPASQPLLCTRWHPKFTFSTFTPDPNLHKSQIYTGPKFTQTQIYTGPIFTQPRFTQIHFRT